MKSAKRVDIVSIQMIKEKSIKYAERRVTSPESAYSLLKDIFNNADREMFAVLCLNTKNEPTHINICHVGTLNTSLVHPREVLKPAVLSNSSSIIIAHNHPSGDTTPSEEDRKVTERLREACAIMGIDLLDHLILGDDKYYSFKENFKI